MIRNIASALFYARFLHAFSILGFRRRVGQLTLDEFDFSGQRWLVTGASGGIGRAVVLKALHSGADVIAVARSQEKLDRLTSEVTGPGHLQTVACDLSFIGKTRALASHPALQRGQIDALVNNVGVLLNDIQLTEEGFEASLATNLLGHFVLTEALLGSDRLAPETAVVEVSSGGMYGVALDPEKMLEAPNKRWDGMTAYALHKRAQVALVQAWNQRWAGQRRAYVMHPGWVDTEGVKTALPGFRASLGRVLRSPDQGADTILWLLDQRPDVADSGGIWLDRHLDAEHAFGFTRNGRYTPDDLYQCLMDAVDSADPASLEA
mgnify:CR=1 FL=1